MHFSPAVVQSHALLWWGPGVALSQLKFKTTFTGRRVWRGEENVQSHLPSKNLSQWRRELLYLIPGVVCKFLPVAASQNNPLARWQFSESFLSALASMPCICFSKCFRDGCANFIWLFSSLALTCCCTYGTLFWVCCLSVDVFELSFWALVCFSCAYVHKVCLVQAIRSTFLLFVLLSCLMRLVMTK